MERLQVATLTRIPPSASTAESPCTRTSVIVSINRPSITGLPLPQVVSSTPIGTSPVSTGDRMLYFLSIFPVKSVDGGQYRQTFYPHERAHPGARNSRNR